PAESRNRKRPHPTSRGLHRPRLGRERGRRGSRDGVESEDSLRWRARGRTATTVGQRPTKPEATPLTPRAPIAPREHVKIAGDRPSTIRTRKAVRRSHERTCTTKIRSPRGPDTYATRFASKKRAIVEGDRNTFGAGWIWAPTIVQRSRTSA